MILEYHRPKTLDAALELLARPEPLTLPLGGGTYLNRPTQEEFAVVDLQSLGLDHFHRRGNILEAGAMVTLQRLSEYSDLPPALAQAIALEATFNLRQQATLAGVIVSSDGRTCLVTALLALDASLEFSTLSGGQVQRGNIELGNLLPARKETLRARLITQISFPLNVRLALHYVSRTPADLPILCTALAQWPSGRTRLALGGFGQTPHLALDGPDAGGLEIAAQAVCQQAEDEWATAKYRSAVVVHLVRRCLQEMAKN